MNLREMQSKMESEIKMFESKLQERVERHDRECKEIDDRAAEMRERKVTKHRIMCDKATEEIQRWRKSLESLRNLGGREQA